MSEVIDCFIFHDELDMLECRLEALSPFVDRFALVEAGQTFQGDRKPFYFLRNEKRFAPWKDRILWLGTNELQGETTWEREYAQREHFRRLRTFGVPLDALILNGDVDEIPTRAAVVAAGKLAEEGLFSAFDYRLCCFAVDWEYPTPLRGTVAGKLGMIESFAEMRRKRDVVEGIQNAGFHFSWLGGKAATLRKLDSFSHTEIKDAVRPGLEADNYLTEGRHVDGAKLVPIEVDGSFPAFIRERRCPANWFRPRG